MSSQPTDRPPLPYDFLPPVPSFELTSQDIAEGEMVPQPHASGIFGAGGDDRSPHLAWSGFPAETRGFAVTCYDPDAPTGSGFWHWAVFDIPADVAELDAGAGDPGGGGLPRGAVTLRNDGGLAQYIGPAPPGGRLHRYVFAVHALDTDSLGLGNDITPAFLGFNLLGHTIARGQLVPVYQQR